MLFKYDVFAFVCFPVPAVYLFAGIFALAERTDIKVIFQNALHRCNAPFFLYPQLRFFTVYLPPQLFRHAGRWDI